MGRPGHSLLVVDDDATLVALLKEGLESAGCRVQTALDSNEGLRLARETRPDMIILDFYLPGDGGGWMYEHLREEPTTAQIPVLFSTGMTLQELHGKVHSHPRTFFLRKPVNLGGIMAVVDRALGPGRLPPAPAPVSSPEPAAGPRRARVHEFDVRVSYADTDKLGVIYYANYFKYFEQGRTELLRSLGVRYRDLEIQRKLYIPAVEASCRYLAPSRYDDLLIVRTWIAELGRASVSFECDIVDEDLNGQIVARGSSRHAVVNDLWRTARIPEDLRQLLEPYVGKGPSASI